MATRITSLCALTLLSSLSLGASEKPAPVVNTVAQAVAARAAKDYPRAILLATEAIAAFPQSGEAFLERALAKFSTRDMTGAAEDFNAAVAADPTNPKAYLYRGDLGYRLIAGDFAGCEADYATVLKLDPEYPQIRAYTAELYLYMKKPDRVITEAVLGLTADPQAPIHKINLAHGLAFSGQMEAAKALYAAIGSVEIGHGRRGAAFALGDIATLKRKNVIYPQMAELITFLETLPK